jgi:hypothetical protein
MGFGTVGAGLGTVGMGFGMVGAGLGTVGMGFGTIGAGLGTVGMGFGMVGAGLGSITATQIDVIFHPRSPPDKSVPIQKRSCITESFRSGLNLIADVIFPSDFSTKPF